MVKDGGPFLVVGGADLDGQEGPLEGGHGVVPNVSAGIGTLGGQSVEDGRPVGGPRYGVLVKLIVEGLEPGSMEMEERQ